MKNKEEIIGIILIDKESGDFVISNSSPGGAIVSDKELDIAKKLFIDGMNLCYAIRNLLSFENHYTNDKELDWIKIPSITFKHLY